MTGVRNPPPPRIASFTPPSMQKRSFSRRRTPPGPPLRCNSMLRIAIVAPLVTTISEPQQGGSQALLADLAVGLTRHGNEVDVYAATGSEIPGVHVIDTGIESASLAGALIHHGLPRRSLDAVDKAYEHAFGMVARGNYDLVHSHRLDPPA